METAISVVLFVFLLLVAAVVARQRNLFSAAMLTGIFSLISAGLFTVMDAVDVAFTEAAVGAGMSTVLVLATLALTDHEERRPSKISWSALAVCALTGAALVYGTLDMPAYGDPNAPIHRHLGRYYLERSWDEIGLPNVVTSVLASYRGYDTFGETSVVFVAGIAVLLLLGKHPAPVVTRPHMPADVAQPRVKEMPVVRVVAKALLPFILLFAFYVQAHGDFGPGGGFQAGVILATAFILFGLVFGPTQVVEFVKPERLERVMALGVLIYGGVGVAAMLAGGTFLAYGAFSPSHPAHGHHWGIFLVELGVGLTVSAVMVVIYAAFSTRPPATLPAVASLPPIAADRVVASAALPTEAVVADASPEAPTHVDVAESGEETSGDAEAPDDDADAEDTP